MSEFDRAVVFGKFWPLHVGHLRLIGEATSRADRVLVVVDDGAEDVPTAVRMGWIREQFPSAEVVSAPDMCGHDTSECTPRCSERYAAWLIDLHGEVDLVVAGDSYGEVLASCLDATSVRLDREQGVSGREIRADLPGRWDLLSRSARAWYCGRVVIVGAESTGTTTLSMDLAEALHTEWVPEYGRRFTEEHGAAHKWVSDDFDVIARRQASDEDAAARRSGPILVCDTDALATAVWHERYMGSRSLTVEALAADRRRDLYVLTSDDIPFIQDGMRDGEHVRGWMTARFREVLEAASTPWVEVRGSRRERLAAVVAALADQVSPQWLTV